MNEDQPDLKNISEDQFSSFRQYQEQQRQERLAREQERSKEEERKRQQDLERELLREQVRREATQQNLIDQLAHVSETASKETDLTHIQQIAQDLKIANKQRQEATLKFQGQLHIRHVQEPYDTFPEQFFHEAWKIAHPETEIIPQYHIGKRRVDFAHPETKTVIEIDGSIHLKRQVRNRDYVRHWEIEDQGWQFVRMTGSQVFQDVDGCVERVYRCIISRQG